MKCLVRFWSLFTWENVRMFSGELKHVNICSGLKLQNSTYMSFFLLLAVGWSLNNAWCSKNRKVRTAVSNRVCVFLCLWGILTFFMAFADLNFIYTGPSARFFLVESKTHTMGLQYFIGIDFDNIQCASESHCCVKRILSELYQYDSWKKYLAVGNTNLLKSAEEGVECINPGYGKIDQSH